LEKERKTMAKNRDGSGRDNEHPEIAMGRTGRKPTREDLTREAIQAAKDAAHSAEMAADAAASLLQGDSGQDQGGHGRGPQNANQGAQQGRQGGTGGRAVADMSDQDQEGEAPMAFEAFMAKLQDAIKRAGDRVEVNDLDGWVKIEGVQNGHKIYVSKTKTVVNRVESTLDPDLIRGATPRSGNGRIASVLPADTRSVGEAIGLLANLEEHVRPPVRGGATGPNPQDR